MGPAPIAGVAIYKEKMIVTNYLGGRIWALNPDVEDRPWVEKSVV